MTLFATLKRPVACDEWQMCWTMLHYTMVGSTLLPFATCDKHLFRDGFSIHDKTVFSFVTKVATRITFLKLNVLAAEQTNTG